MDNMNKIPGQEHKQRLLSLDTLRGFDMFWLIGGGALIEALSKCFPAAWLQVLARQMEHVNWAGFHFEDLIFPLFMFISGVTIPLAVLSKLEKGSSRKDVILKNARRMIILIALGIIYNGVLRNGFSTARYTSILAQIGISYFIASLIIIYSKSVRSQLIWLAGLLTAYSVVQLLIPVPGAGAGVLTPTDCINSFIDRLLLPGRLAYDANAEMAVGNGVFDALGILSTISSVGMTLMGYFAGRILLRNDSAPQKKVLALISAGAGLIVFALILSPFYPVIKKCWTTTYNLLSGGISFILLAMFYYVIDVRGYRNWTLFFRVIGVNSIFSYLLVTGSLLEISYTTTSLFGWIINPMGENGGQLVLVLGNITLGWLLLYYMYRKNILIKV
jgi:predicted acyltransferase